MLCAAKTDREPHDTGSCRCLQPDEMLIIEKMEKMVDPDQPEGEWITKYDLVEKVHTCAATIHVQTKALTRYSRLLQSLLGARAQHSVT